MAAETINAPYGRGQRSFVPRRSAPRFPAPVGSLADVFARLTRCDLDTIVDSAIEELDRRDGDCDIEYNGDEFDSSLADDDFLCVVVGGR